MHCPQVLEDGRQWWKLRNRSGQAGYVPCNILAEARPEEVGAPPEQVGALGALIRREGQSLGTQQPLFHSHFPLARSQ